MGLTQRQWKVEPARARQTAAVKQRAAPKAAAQQVKASKQRAEEVDADADEDYAVVGSAIIYKDR